MTQDAFKRMGVGEPLLCLVSKTFADSELAKILGARYTLVLPINGATNGNLAAQEASAVPLRVLASGANCAAALEIAYSLGEKAGAVVLLSPPPLERKADMDAPKFQTLAMFGVRGAPAPEAGAFKRAHAASHIMYVFDADDLERERPQAVAEAALDFLTRGEGFLVNNLDGRIFA